MSFTFEAIREPSAELIEKIAGMNPENPFATNGYIEAKRRGGCSPVAILIRRQSEIKDACFAFVRRGWLNASLEIVSLPILSKPDLFWDGLGNFCRQERVSFLSVNSFASPEADIEMLDGETARRKRVEFRLNLESGDIWEAVSKRHKRRIRKAEKAGLEIRSSSDLKSCTDHAARVNRSLQRLRDRGDAVGRDVDAGEIRALVRSGSGIIYSAERDGEVLSSLLVLRSEKGAYFQTSATSEVGRSCGASHFLCFEVGRKLQSENVRVFNLGGADESSGGLRQFKSDFGTCRVELESAEFHLGGPLQRAARRASSLLHEITLIGQKALVPIVDSSQFQFFTSSDPSGWLTSGLF